MQPSGISEDSHGRSGPVERTVDCTNQLMLERLSIKFTMDFRKENSDVWPLLLLRPIQKFYIPLLNRNKIKTRDFTAVMMPERTGSNSITISELLCAHSISHE